MADIKEIEAKLNAMSDNDLVITVDAINKVTTDIDYIHHYNMCEFNSVYEDYEPLSIAVDVKNSSRFDINDDYFTREDGLSTCSWDEYIALLRKSIGEIAEAYAENEDILD